MISSLISKYSSKDKFRSFEQYSLIRSYMAELMIRGKEAKIDIVDNVYMR